MRSKKFTNWLNTMLFVVASCRRRLLSSSRRASIFVDERHLSKLSRPRMPCRTLTFSSSSSAGPSRSMVKATWQMGHAGWFRLLGDKRPTRSIVRLTVGSIDASRYCLMHSRSNMCRHFAWMASSANSLHRRHTVPSPSSSFRKVPRLFLLRITRSGWQAICRMRVSKLKMLE